MKTKGFTLIELLAVIVILAIIALIATPVILGIIDDARTNANARSIELIKSGVQNAYSSYLIKNNGNTIKIIPPNVIVLFFILCVDGPSALSVCLIFLILLIYTLYKKVANKLKTNNLGCCKIFINNIKIII